MLKVSLVPTTIYLPRPHREVLDKEVERVKEGGQKATASTIIQELIEEKFGSNSQVLLEFIEIKKKLAEIEEEYEAAEEETAA